MFLIILSATLKLKEKRMPSVRVSKQNNCGIYFLTIKVNKLYYVLDRYFRWNIIADSLKYCQKNKGLRLFGFVFMINHIHLLVFSENIIGFIRDFKSFTSKEMLKNIKNTEPNLMKLFVNENNCFEFWESKNMPKFVESDYFFSQKLKYIHENPIKKNYVLEDKYWYWSSANGSCELKADDVNEFVFPGMCGSGEDA